MASIGEIAEDHDVLRLASPCKRKALQQAHDVGLGRFVLGFGQHTRQAP